MNYFKLFNIQPIYELNAEELESAYLVLQQKYHPDNCESIEEQLQAVEKTIQINEAYDVLSDEVALIVYYVKIEFNLELSDKEIQAELSQDDLMFLLNIQEDIMNNKQKLKEKTSSFTLKVKQAIKQQKIDDLKSNLAKLIFFNKSLKHA